MFGDLHLVADDGRAVAVVPAPMEVRDSLADALSWYVSRRFAEGEVEADGVVALRAAGALADRIDEHRGVEGLAHLRVDAGQVRSLIEAASAYVSDRDTESYQSPEERARIAVLRRLVDPLFDLVAQLDRADEVLGAPPL